MEGPSRQEINLDALLLIRKLVWVQWVDSPERVEEKRNHSCLIRYILREDPEFPGARKIYEKS
jgi:hypothetical protein